MDNRNIVDILGKDEATCNREQLYARFLIMVTAVLDLTKENKKLKEKLDEFQSGKV